MNELYLLAHKVRGEPAFDIGLRMPCPECFAQGCVECDEEGYWWVIPTSGHRAYPYWHFELNVMGTSDHLGEFEPLAHMNVGDMPSSLPDHYPTRVFSASTTTVSLATALGLHLRPPSAPIRRRV